MPRPHACPHCAAEESLVAVGPGVERLQEEAANLFPDARTMVLSSDLITSIETMRSELNEIAEGRSISSSAPSWWRRAITFRG